jgi:uncharacterized protein
VVRTLLLSLLLLGGAGCERPAAATGCTDRPAAALSSAGSGEAPPVVAVDSGNGSAPLPPLVGRVIDQAEIVSAGAEERLDARLVALEGATSDQLVIVTLTSLRGEPIEQVGLRYGNDWKIGRADFDNGVLLIVAPNERTARIEVGCGLEGLLTDAKAKRIMDEQLVPRFRSGRYEEGMEAGVDAIGAVLRSDTRRPRPKPKAAG